MKPTLTDVSKWNERAPMPQGLAGCAVGALDGKLIVAGGTYWKDGTKRWTSRVDSFEPATNRWESLAPIPVPYGDAACVAYGDALYLFGGGSEGVPAATTWRLRGGAWSAVPEMALPAARRSTFAAVIGDTIYVLCGFGGTELSSASNTLWAGKPGKPWEARTSLPNPIRFNPAIASAGGRLLVVGGGTQEQDGKLRNLDDVLAYDPGANTWTALKRLPAPARAACGVEDGTRFLSIGGYTDRFDRQILSIDPKTGEATPAGMLPIGLADTRFVRVGSRIIGVSGECGDKIRAPWTLEANAATA